MSCELCLSMSNTYSCGMTSLRPPDDDEDDPCITIYPTITHFPTFIVRVLNGNVLAKRFLPPSPWTMARRTLVKVFIILLSVTLVYSNLIN